MVNKTQRLLKSMKQTNHKVTPIATDMILPNHSGMAAHPELKNNFIRQDGTSSATTGSILIGDDLGIVWNDDGGSAETSIKADITTATARTITLNAKDGHINFTLDNSSTIKFEDNINGGVTLRTDSPAGSILWISNSLFPLGTNGFLGSTSYRWKGLAIGESTFGGKIELTGGSIIPSFISLKATNATVFFGASANSSILHDGTDFVFNSGAGDLKLNSASNWTANGTNTVTISNLAPSGVGTATISKWFTIKDNAGTVYYLPAWT